MQMMLHSLILFWVDDSATDFTKLNAKICILPVLSQTSPIPLHRLSPSHSNIRVSAASDSNQDDTTTPTHLPTPLYNTALLQTLLPKYQLLAVHALQNEIPAFSDALTLLRVWANQRGYSEGTKMCIRGFEGAGPWWWSLLALLLNGEEGRPNAPKSSRRRSVGKGLSSYQLFKAALEFLGQFFVFPVWSVYQITHLIAAKHDFEKESVFVRAAEGHKVRHWSSWNYFHFFLICTGNSSRLKSTRSTQVLFSSTHYR